MVVKVGINGFLAVSVVLLPPYPKRRRCWSYSHQRPYRSSYACTLVEIRHKLKGRFDGTVEVKEGGFEVNGKFVKVSAERDPEQIDWATDGVEIVLEATGFFAKKDAAEKHLKGGAKKDVITALVKRR